MHQHLKLEEDELFILDVHFHNFSSLIPTMRGRERGEESKGKGGKRMGALQQGW
jgi:hypothetical protein